jgi:hypothetical protein
MGQAIGEMRTAPQTAAIMTVFLFVLSATLTATETAA